MTYLILWLLIGPLVGGMLGHDRNCAGLGMVLGLLLGPIGWIMIIVKAAPLKCPECFAPAPPGARRCQKCGQPIPGK